MRASRLVQLLLLLQTRGRLTAPELAAELEVSVRTIYRDLEALSAAGVPVYCETGRNGGARLVDGYRTRLTGLTTDEADALLLAGVPGPAADLGLGTVLAAAQLKVLAALPPELRSRATRVQQRFHLDAPGWFHRDDRAVERIVAPLGLVLKAGVWYVVAAADGADDPASPRTYRAARIVSVEVLDEGFERPDGFDLAAHWTSAAAEFAARMYPESARIRVRSDALFELRMALDPVVARGALDAAAGTAPDADGWYTLDIPVEREEYTAPTCSASGPRSRRSSRPSCDNSWWRRRGPWSSSTPPRGRQPAWRGSATSTAQPRAGRGGRSRPSSAWPGCLPRDLRATGIAVNRRHQVSLWAEFPRDSIGRAGPNGAPDLPGGKRRD